MTGYCSFREARFIAVWISSRPNTHTILCRSDDLAKVLLNWKQQSCFQRDEFWVFPNPATEKPYWQEEIQKKHIKPAAEAAGLGTGIGWHTFRHTYRTLLDETGAPMKVQQELMRTPVFRRP